MFGSVELLVYTFVVFQLYLIVLKLVYLIRIKHLFIEIMNLGCFILSVNLFEINIYDSFQIPIKVRFFDLCGPRAEIWSKLIGSPFFISVKAVDIELIITQKNQYSCTGFFVCQ